jgi:hypothetical protein
MAASRVDISGWFDRGVKQGATHMIVICDTYDYEDYPKFINADTPEQAKKLADAENGVNMQQVMEVYNLKMDKQSQMDQHRAFNY